MSDEIHRHLSSDKEFLAAANTLKRAGENAMTEEPAQRNESIRQMQESAHMMEEYLQKKTPEERKQLLAIYNDADTRENSPSYSGMGNGGIGFGRAFSMPTGSVETDNDGNIVGVKFTESVLSNVWTKLTGGVPDEINVKP